MNPSELTELRFYASVILREHQQRADRENRCLSKVAYGTRAQAERGIRRKARREGVQSYRCELCQMWHVGARRVGR